MRGNTLVAVLSLAILAGTTLTAEAQRAGGPNRGGGGNQVERDDPGAGDGEELREIRRQRPRPCELTASIDCPREKKIAQNLPPREDDCECKLKAMLVGGRTKIVKDCYQEIKVDGAKRVRYCEIPEKE